MRKLWSVETFGQPPHRVRQIVLTNQIGLFAAGSTVPFLAYYLASDPGFFLPVILANLAFIGCYGVALGLIRGGHFDAARNLALGTVFVQLFVVTSLISSGAGVHLFYFALAATFGMLLVRRSEPLMFGLALLAVALFIVSELAFGPGNVPLEPPPAALDVMYAFSVLGAMLGATWFPYLFRVEIDRAYAALEESNRELERLSGLDPLTGLPNRRALDLHLSRELARLRRSQEPVSLLIFDVDRFKQYNDHYGHLAGDACLQRVASALREIARRGGDLVARYGGEEFVVVLPNTDGEVAARIAERARESVAALEIDHRASEVAPTVTVSAGLACAAGEGPLEPPELLRRADLALYDAKRGGRNRVAASNGADARPGGAAAAR